MADQQSRLSIVIDSRDAERRIAALRARLRELGQQSDDTGRNTDDLGRRVRGASEESSKFSKVLGGLTKFAKVGGLAIAGIGAAAIKVSGNFEEAMNGVRAVSGAVGKDFDQMRELAKKMGSETAYSATEAANGMEFLAMAGLNTEQIMKTLPNALNLAAAGNIGLAESADILSNIMTGMGVSADESGRAADVLAATAAAANVDVKMLGESMKYAAPIAKQLGISLEDTAASMGILGNAGIQGGEAGTALRAIYTRLATHKKSKEWFDSLGLSVTDASGNMKGMVTILKELQGASQDLSAQDKLSMYKDTVGTEAMSALGVTIDSITDGSLDRLIEKLDGAEGSAKRMADIRMEGFNGAIKGAKSAAEGFLIAIGDSGLLDLAAGAVTGLANGIRGLTEWLPTATADITAFFQSAEVATAFDMAISGLKTAWDNLVSVISAAGDVIAPVIEFFREHDKLSEALAISIGLVAGAFVIYNAAVVVGAAATSAFTGALLWLTSPVTLTIAALVALTAAGVYVYQNWDMIKAKGVEIWGSISSYIGGVIDSIKSYFTNTFPALTAIVSTQFNLVKNVIMTVLGVVKAIISGDFKAIPSIIGDGLKNAVTIVSNLMGQILTTIKDYGAKLFNIGRDFIQGFINGIKSIGSSVVGAASSMVGSAIAAVKKKQDSASPSKVTAKLGGDFSQGMANGIKKGAKAVKTEAQRMAESAINAVEDGISGLQKRIALFGDNSAVSSLLYDINAGDYKGASQSRINEYVKQQKALERLGLQLKATDSIQARFDKLEDDRAAKRAAATDLIKGRFAQFSKDKASSSDNLQGMLSGLEQESPMGKIQADYEARNALIEKYEQTHTDMINVANEARLASDQAYMDAKRDLMLTQGEALFGDLAGLAKGFAGEQSTAYKALFAVEKGFAIAQSAMAIQQSIAKAMALGFPQNIPVVATAVSQGATLMGNISSINAGFKDGGYTGNMGVNQVAGAVHGQEYVFDAESTKRIGVSNLEAMSKGKAVGGGDVNISVTVTGDSAQVSGDNESMGREMANGIKAVVMDVMRKEKRQGGMLYA